jgi:outer membrane protein OmpA-like peptidoglycan-associated protein
MRIGTTLLAGSIVLLVAGPAGAGGSSAYSPEDIVKFFANQDASRGICVGTDEECGPTDKKPAGFNLRLNFAKDSAMLSDEARANLDSFAAALNSPSLSVASFAIEGHTDASGTDQHNMDLSQRRADSVVTYLAGLGVDPTKLKPVGLGETAPATADAYDAENRRVETRLILE